MLKNKCKIKGDNIEEIKKCRGYCIYGHCPVNCTNIDYSLPKIEDDIKVLEYREVRVERYLLSPNIFKDFFYTVVWQKTTPIGLKWEISEKELRYVIKKVLKEEYSIDVKGYEFSYKEKLHAYEDDDECFRAVFDGIEVTLKLEINKRPD